MTISTKAWNRYIASLRQMSDKAANVMRQVLNRYNLANLSDNDRKEIISAAYDIISKYGEGSGALAGEMYDALVELAGKSGIVPPAEIAQVSYPEVAKAVNGTVKTGNPDIVSQAIGRQVKMIGADTTLHNAIRDGAEWAWIPRGDTCAFCLTLASRGWQRASKAALKNGHAEHIHANCDCTYAVRFDSRTEVEGYKPSRYLKMYNSADPGGSPKDKINAMRREIYAENKEQINAQKRSAYEKSKERESSAAEEMDV